MPHLPPRPDSSPDPDRPPITSPALLEVVAWLVTATSAVLLAVAAALRERARRVRTRPAHVRRARRSVAAALCACCLVTAGASYVLDKSGSRPAPPRSIAAAEAAASLRPDGAETTTTPASAKDETPTTAARHWSASAKVGPGASRKAAATTSTVPRKATGKGSPDHPGQLTPDAAKALAALSGQPRPVVPIRNGTVPTGKGMWLWLPERSEGGNVEAIVLKAKAYDLSHLYVRTGSSWNGFDAAPFLDAILPAAHRAGIRVYGWDFPRLIDWQADVNRAMQAITYATPTGDRIDGFVADIERASEGTRLTPDAALAYGTLLRQRVGWGYPLVACVPKLSGPETKYPYPHVVAQFDAIAPMVYWMNREPGYDVALSLQWLKQFGKPIIPVGQAYDGAIDGGPSGSPNRMAIHRFMGVAEQWGASGVSFWDWQEATQEQWDAIRDAPWFRFPTDGTFNDSSTRSVQAMLRSMGFGGTDSGRWDQPSIDALKAYQQAAGLPVTGMWSLDTRRTLLTPFSPPIRPILP